MFARIDSQEGMFGVVRVRSCYIDGLDAWVGNEFFIGTVNYGLVYGFSQKLGGKFLRLSAIA